jgi:hypothetical protein
MLIVLRALLVSAVLALGLVGTASVALAEQVVFEQLPAPSGDIQHAYPGGSLIKIEVSEARVITAVAQRARFDVANEVRFVVLRLDGGAWTPLVGTTPQTQAVQGFAYVQSPDFPALTLEAGKTYAIGMLTRDGGHYLEYGASLPVAPVDGILVIGKDAYTDYSLTTLPQNSNLAFSLKLLGPDPVPVPTLSEWSLILMGLILAGGAAVWLQRRRTA